MKAKIKVKGKEILVEDIKKVSGIEKYTGLMFRRKSPALLFEMKNKAIHSFFCKPFIAIWLFEGKVAECKIVDKWLPFIKPKNDFDRLIEIPLNKKYEHLAEFFVGKT